MGKINEEQKKTLISQLETYADNSEDTIKMIAGIIIGNLQSEDIVNDSSPIEDAKQMHSIVSDLQALVNHKDPDVTFEQLSEAIGEKFKYYEKEPDEATLTIEDKLHMKLNMKTLLVPDKEGIYSPIELGYLKHIIKEISKGRPVPMVYDSGHVLTALDVKQHNGKWFVLMRDPFNIERAEYSVVQDEENENGQLNAGEVEKKFYGLYEVYDRHLDIRELTPDVKSGFMGISWWELKDVTEKFTDFSIPG